MQIQLKVYIHCHCNYIQTWFLLPCVVRFVERIYHHYMLFPICLEDQHSQTSELLSCKTNLYFKHYAFGEMCVLTVTLWCLLCFLCTIACIDHLKDGMSGSLNLILFTRIVPLSQQINLSAEQKRQWLAKKLLSGFLRRRPGLGRPQLPPLIPFDKLLWKSCLFSFSLGAF